MKQTKLLIIPFTVCMMFQSLIVEAGETDGNISTDSSTEICLKSKRKYPLRPGMPDRQMIICTYTGDELVFEFTLSEGLCEVTLTDINTNVSSFYNIDSSELTASIYVGAIGESEIEVSTESGNTYYGVLSSDE